MGESPPVEDSSPLGSAGKNLPMITWLLSKLGWPPSGMLVPDDYPEARIFINRMQTESLPFIATRTVVLYGATTSGKPYILGTGVPFACADHRFILTASHVLDAVKRDQAAVYLRSGNNGGPLEPLDPVRAHRSVMPSVGGRHADPFDVCVIELSEDQVGRLGDSITYVTPDCIDPYDNSAIRSYYLLHGFPAKNLRVNFRKKTLACRSLPYGTVPYDGSRGPYPPA